MLQLISKPPRHMFIVRDRLFYGGLIGNSREVRRHGGLTVYVAVNSCFDIRIGDGLWKTGSVFAVEPFVAHYLWSARGHICCVSIETETVDQLAIARLVAAINNNIGDTSITRNILSARHDIPDASNDRGLSSVQFDQHFLGQVLPARQLDQRIQQVLDMLARDPDNPMLSADDCAASISLSTSRFLHLFKDSTGLPFRSFRMWKRARRFLDRANHSASLTDVALDLGYPDSTHFSHSIRATFGLRPRTIRAEARSIPVGFG